VRRFSRLSKVVVVLYDDFVARGDRSVVVTAEIQALARFEGEVKGLADACDHVLDGEWAAEGQCYAAKIRHGQHPIQAS
jgi:predicted YcjX-like family ATPase